MTDSNRSTSTKIAGVAVCLLFLGIFCWTALAQEEAQDETAALLEEGATVFAEHCAACHGAEGGGTGSAPKLAGNSVLEDGARVARQVLFGGDMMPSFGETLSDLQVAAVVSHVRTSWGNDYGPFTVEEVAQEKAKFQ